MINSNMISNEDNINYDQNSQNKNLTNATLPIEILKEILSYLDDVGLQQTSLVSKLWSRGTVYTASHNVSLKINYFKKFLNKCSNTSYKVDIEKLSYICKQILNLANLIQIKSSLQENQEAIVNMLKVLKYDKSPIYKDFYYRKHF